MTTGSTLPPGRTGFPTRPFCSPSSFLSALPPPFHISLLPEGTKGGPPSVLPSFRHSLFPSFPPSLPSFRHSRENGNPSEHPSVRMYPRHPPCHVKMDSRFRGNDRRRGNDVRSGSALPLSHFSVLPSASLISFPLAYLPPSGGGTKGGTWIPLPRESIPLPTTAPKCILLLLSFPQRGGAHNTDGQRLKSVVDYATQSLLLNPLLLNPHRPKYSNNEPCLPSQTFPLKASDESRPPPAGNRRAVRQRGCVFGVFVRLCCRFASVSVRRPYSHKWAIKTSLLTMTTLKAPRLSLGRAVVL